MTADLTTAPSPCDVLVREAIRAETLRTMVERCALKRVPGTHGEQAAMVGCVDELLDRWLDVVGDGRAH